MGLLDLTSGQEDSLIDFGSGLLSASGPSRMPVSLGQAFGAGMQGMRQGDQQRMQNQMQQAQMKMMPGQLQLQQMQIDSVKKALIDEQESKQRITDYVNSLPPDSPIKAQIVQAVQMKVPMAEVWKKINPTKDDYTVGNMRVSGQTNQSLFTAPKERALPQGMELGPDGRTLVEIPGYTNMMSKIAAAGRAPAQERQPQIIQTDSGPMVYANGQATPIMGPGNVPIKGQSTDKPLSEIQGKATTFGMRAQEASKIIDSVGMDGNVQPGLIKRSLESVPFAGEGLGTMANFTQSAKQQQIEQAQRDFVNAVLRLESGAAISPGEFDNAKKQYFPQPGDSKEVISQKKSNRETEIRGLSIMAGPGAKQIPQSTMSSGGWSAVKR